MSYKERFVSDEVPDGRYPVIVLKSEIGPWSERNPDLRWQLELEIVGGKFAGRHLWYKTGLSEKAAGFRRGAITALGIVWRDREVDLEREPIGKRCDAEVVYNADYDRAEVKRLRTQKAEVAPGQADFGELPEVNFGATDGVPF